MDVAQHCHYVDNQLSQAEYLKFVDYSTICRTVLFLNSAAVNTFMKI